MPQIKVADKNDECLVGWYNTEWLLASPTYDLHVGYLYAGWYKLGNASIFRNVRVPQGKTIQLARITFTAFSDAQRDDVNSYIHGELNPHPLPFSTYENYAARVRTDARVTWDQIPHWTHQQEYKTPDLKAIIQEIVNLPEWEEGDDICIFWDDHDDRTTHEIETYRNAYPYFTDPLLAPLLTIHWLEDTLMESYTIGGDTYYPLDVHKAAAQTFVPQEQFEVHWVDLQLKYWFSTARPWVHIYQCGTPAHPIGDPLSRSIAEDRPFMWPGQTARVRFKMTPYVLEPETMYILVVRQSPTFFEIPDEWLYDAGDATYPRGYRVAQEGTDEPWDTHLNDDHIFAIFGSPPAPPPPPEPPVRNWTILDIQQTITATGFKIAVITNVPCHLYMMWTNKEPNKHKIVGLRRGDLALRETRYCFTNWHKNEQEEAGDTLTHTFYKEPWPICETRWFTFKGEVETLWTASAGPIFKKHRPSPPITRYFYSDAHPESTSVDGIVQHLIWAGLYWPQLRAAPGNDFNDIGLGIPLQFYGSATRNKFYSLSRVIALYDTSAIPPGSTILDAKLRIFINAVMEQGYYPDCKAALVASNPASNTQLEPADYQRVGTTLLSNDLALITDYAVEGAYFTYNLNPAGLLAIIPGGITKLGLREYYYDILDNIPPYTGFRRWGFSIYSADQEELEDKPRLEVTYKLP